MSLQCKKCGAHVPGWASYCNKCGARIPAEKVPDHLICPNCRKIQSDLRSRFCDRCGIPVTPLVQPLPPAAPAMQTKACPRCGFRNSGPSLFFCKKCGSSLEAGESPGQVTERRLSAGAVRIPASRGEAMAYETGKGAAWTPPVAGHYQEFPLKHVRSYRKVAIGIAVLILIIAVIAGVVFFTKSVGTSSGGPDTESGSGLLGLIPTGDILGAMMGNATAPDPARILPNKNAGAGLVTNRAASVVIDTPLITK